MDCGDTTVKMFRLVLAAKDGTVLVERTIAARDGAPIVSEIGFEAMSMYGALHGTNSDPVGTTLTVEDAPINARPSAAILYRFPYRKMRK